MNMIRDKHGMWSDHLRDFAKLHHYGDDQIDRAIAWAFEQCDGLDDYETLETTMMARLEDTEQTGER